MLTEDRQAQKAQRRATAVVAGVVALLALVIVGAVVFVVRGGGPGTSSARSPVIPPESRGGEVTSTLPGRTDVLTADTVRWSDFHGISVPVAAAGPTKVQGGRASGFAHTSAGAVLAAIHISYRSESSAGPLVFEPTIAEQVVGPDKGTFLSNREASYQTSKARYGVGPDGAITADYDKAQRERVRVWAYRVDSYDPANASVQLLSQFVAVGGTTPSYVNFAVTVRWVDGDWRILAPFNGEWATGATSLPDVPRGYTVLGAQ